MAETYDVVIRGGTIIDGTGASAAAGDLAIRNGRIAAVGDIRGSAARTIDAEGAIVAPGFVDIHTHYDAQIFWDRGLTPSSWHGVTTVVMGNCGFGVAPTRPEHRDLILRTLENVEGMSLRALHAGLGEHWPFEHFAEYLDAIESRGSVINVGVLVGHTPVRTYVMGDAAVEREATLEEIQEMRALVAGALAAGALGLATSKSINHVGYDGHPVPSRVASLEEIRSLADTLSATESGVMQVALGPGFFVNEFVEIYRRTGRPISWTALLGGMRGPHGHRAILEQSQKLQDAGIAVIPQVSCRPLMFEFQLKAPLPLETLKEMAPYSKQDAAGRLRLLSDAEFRRTMRQGIDSSAIRARLYDMRISEYSPEPNLEERTIADVAAERGVHPVDLTFDLSIQTNLEARFRMGVLNTEDDVIEELLKHPSTMLGLSDAGAHASQLCDAGAPTTLLGKWVRERRAISLEEAVRRLTSQPADVFGIHDRGRLAEGLAADVTVFDPKTVDCGPLRRVFDFPDGADRLVADASGIRSVVVNGQPVRMEDRDLLDPDGSLPGRVLRGGCAR